MKELTQEQVNVLGEKARNIAGNAAESSLPLMLRDLGKQIAETGDSKMQAMFKFGFQLSDTGDYVMDMDVEWVRKIKHKDAFASERINFEQPELPGLDTDKPASAKPTPKQLNTAPLQLSAGTREVLCLCGHSADDHDKEDGDRCTLCVCEVYEEDVDGKEAETRKEMHADTAEEATAPMAPIAAENRCGDCALFVGECPENEDTATAFTCKAFKAKAKDTAEKKEPKENIAYSKFLLSGLKGDDVSQLYPVNVGRNANKLGLVGTIAVMIGSDERSVCRVLEVGAKSSDNLALVTCEVRNCGTKAGARREYKALLDAGAMDPANPVRTAQFTALYRIRYDGVVWITDDAGNWRKGTADEQDAQAWHDRANALEG